MGQGRRALAALLSIAVAVVLAVAIDEGLGVASAATKMGRVFLADDVGDQAKFALGGGLDSSDGDAAVPLAGEQTGIEAVPPWFEEELFALGGAFGRGRGRRVLVRTFGGKRVLADRGRAYA